MKRSDSEYVNEVWRRWERRRWWRVTKASAAMDAAGTELMNVFVMPMVRLIERVPFLRWLVR